MSARLTSVVLLAVVALSLACAVCHAQALTDLPPRVIDCNPKPFAVNVDVGLKQISVTFDRPMDTNSRGGVEAVRFAGVGPVANNVQGTWDPTGTILSLPAALEPDVTYSVAVNSSKNRGITDTRGVPALAFSWVFSTGERAPEDFPAYVVKCEPELGAAEADFRLQQIKVTFSRPVAPGDFSWTILRGSGEYPGTRQGPPPQLSADRLTATLDVRLSPNTVYAIGVNDVYYYGYKDTKGRPVLPFGLCFKTAK